MLNIDDIQKRLKDFPEPTEVEMIRKEITDRYKDMEFVEKGHKYLLHNADGTVTEMTSVTNMCHKYEKEVDWDSIAKRKAIKDGVDVNALKRQWKEKNIISTSNGSLTHLFAEAYMWFFMGKPENMPHSIMKYQYEDGFLIPYGKKQEAVAKFYDDLYKVRNFYPVMPETCIYIKKDDNKYGIKYNIGGTFDALFAYKDKDGNYSLSIFDWKTNAALENDYNKRMHVTLLPPFDKEFVDQPKSIYTLQLSLYSLGLSQANYNVADRKLVHLKESGEYEKIRLQDVSALLANDLSK